MTCAAFDSVLLSKLIVLGANRKSNYQGLIKQDKSIPWQLNRPAGEDLTATLSIKGRAKDAGRRLAQHQRPGVDGVAVVVAFLALE